MRYHLWVNDEAKAKIKRLPGYMRQRIRRAVQSLSSEPRPHYSLEREWETHSPGEKQRD